MKYYVYKDIDTEGKLIYKVADQEGCTGCILKYKALRVANRVEMHSIEASSKKEAAAIFAEEKGKEVAL